MYGLKPVPFTEGVPQPEKPVPFIDAFFPLPVIA
jgi:hypothetical protein